MCTLADSYFLHKVTIMHSAHTVLCANTDLIANYQRELLRTARLNFVPKATPPRADGEPPPPPAWRPIAMGTTFQRAVSAYAINTVIATTKTLKPCKFGLLGFRGSSAADLSPEQLKRITEALTPYQYGFGNADGCLAAVNALVNFRCPPASSPPASWRDVHVPPDENVIVCLDNADAFQNVDRSVMLAELHRHYPELYSYVHQKYGGEPLRITYYDGANVRRDIEQRCGVQQGDTLGSFLFCITLAVALRAVAAQLQAVANVLCPHFGGLSPERLFNLVAYADDTNAKLPAILVPPFFCFMTQQLATVGLQLRPHKCSIYLCERNPLLEDAPTLIDAFKSDYLNVESFSR